MFRSRSLVSRRHKEFVYEAAFVNAGQEIVTVSRDGTVRFWNSTTGKEIEIDGVRIHSDAVTSLSVTLDGSIVATGSYDGSVVVWDAFSRRPTKHLMHPERSINAVRLSPDGILLVTWSTERNDFARPEAQGEVSLWRLR